MPNIRICSDNFSCVLCKTSHVVVLQKKTKFNTVIRYICLSQPTAVLENVDRGARLIKQRFSNPFAAKTKSAT